MKLLSQKYQHKETGIEFEVWFEEKWVDTEHPMDVIKKIRVDSKAEQGKFIFNKSSSETLIKIGTAIREIGEFVSKL